MDFSPDYARKYSSRYLTEKQFNQKAVKEAVPIKKEDLVVLKPVDKINIPSKNEMDPTAPPGTYVNIQL